LGGLKNIEINGEIKINRGNSWEINGRVEKDRKNGDIKINGEK
jgi:hypothetical protein